VQRYWLEFEQAADLRPDTALGFGVGVTVWTVSHALRMIEWYFGSLPPSVARVVENVDASLLELPAGDCGVLVWPGIWRPAAPWGAKRTWARPTGRSEDNQRRQPNSRSGWDRNWPAIMPALRSSFRGARATVSASDGGYCRSVPLLASGGGGARSA